MSIVFGTDKPVKKIIDSFFGIFGIDNGIYWWYTDLRKQKNTVAYESGNSRMPTQVVVAPMQRI